MNTDETFNRKRPLSILTNDNYQQWFELAKMHFDAEGIHYVIESSLSTHAKITTLTPASDASSSNGLNDKFARLTLNIDKVAQ